MKRIMLSITGIILILAICILSACTQSSPTSPSTPTTPTSPSKPASSAPVVLKWSCPWPPGSTPMVRRQDYLDQLEEKSNGHIKIELYGVGQLCEPKENVEAVQTGVADIAAIISSYTPGLFPRSQVLEAPIFTLRTDDPWKVSYSIMSEMRDEIDAEFERNGLVSGGQYWLGGVVQIFSKDKLSKLEDFKGIKISCVSEVHSEALQSLGMAPSMIPGAETYLALEKGVIDAALQTHGGARITKYDEVCNYVTILNWPQLGFAYAYNPDSLANLSTADKEFVMNEMWDYHENIEIGKYKQFSAEDYQWVIDHGIETVELSDEEFNRITNALPSLDKWIEDQKKVGIDDAEELSERILALIEKYT
jgi:TRAP-type transport system periplasmic protein